MSNTKKVVAIVQARMGSLRLPGKVLMQIEGMPMLWHVVSRLSYCKLINQIIIATSENKNDDLIEEFCVKNKIHFYRGSENDVLDRYYQAAVFYAADAVVRITADCPLIDPIVTDKVITSFIENGKDFDGASNIIKRTFPRGLDTEIFNFLAIERAWRDSRDNYHREHVTPYIYEHAGFFKVFSVENEVDFSNFRWTVDEEADLRFVKEIYGKLYNENNIFYMRDILKALDINPSFNEINAGVKQRDINS